MPTLTPEEVRVREDLCKKYRIVFAGETNPSEWPDQHKRTLQQVRELGNRKYDTYDDSPEQDDYEPWRAERKSLATVLVQIAARFNRRNESSWRHACEPIVLGRLSAEVCCRACRKRIWRSDIEVSRDGNTGVATQLRNRQLARQPCRCPRQSRSQDHLEAVGLNQIFNYRVEEQVTHDPDVTKDLNKKERPDRIYGLRQTRNIENLLNDTIKRRNEHEVHPDGTQVQEVLGLPLPEQPIQQSGDRQLFPFLVLEAKSAMSGSDWHSIQMQTAFSIRTFLQTQNSLRAAAGQQSRWESGPLVWFLSNRGEDWRLHAAFVQEGMERAHAVGNIDYHVIDMWRGCILSLDGALQLLLLVDYIFDWARDIYREDIIRELRVLASGDNDAASVMGTDLDIHSYGRLDPFDHISQGDSEGDDLGRYIESRESFLALDSKIGAVRHATFVESRFCCVLITGDNVQTLIQSTEPKIVQQLCKLILEELARNEPVRIEPQALGKIEEEWTGTCRLPGALQHMQDDLYTAISSTVYLDNDWHQVRELFAIAVAHNAWPAIIAAARLNRKRVAELSPPTLVRCNSNSVLRMIKRLRAGTPQEVLLSAITRRAVRISQTVDKSNIIKDRFISKCVTRKDYGVVRGVVNFIYTSYKKGTLEPQEPFLRLSKKFDLQHSLNQQSDVKPVVFSEHRTLQTSTDGCVLLTATRGRPRPEDLAATFCLYLTEDNGRVPEVQKLSHLVQKVFETRDVYHTMRGDRSSRSLSKVAGQTYSSFTQRPLWNTRESYGVYSHGSRNFSLCKLLKERDADPLTQGSSRDANACGAQLHERDFSAWWDDGHYSQDNSDRLFLVYKLFTTEITYWRGVAKERRERGISCCECCAALGHHEICSACEGVFGDENRCQWYKNALRGREAFPVRPLGEDELKARLQAIESGYPSRVSVKYTWDKTDWEKHLDFYAELNQPFTSISELSEQWRRFKAFCFRNRPIQSLEKRKRSDTSDETDSVEGI